MKNWSNALEILLFLVVLGVAFYLVVEPSKNDQLIEAASFNNTNEVIKLIKNGANVNCATKHVRMTPLMIASSKGHQEMVNLLLNSGADLSQKDRNGKTAYNYAIENGWTNLFKHRE